MALSASRTVPRGWSIDTTGVSSGRRPVTRPPSAPAAPTTFDRSPRPTARTTISLVALIPPSLRQRVRLSARLISSAPRSRPGNEDQRQDGRDGGQDGRRPKARRHEIDDDANPARPPGEVGRSLRE